MATNENFQNDQEEYEFVLSNYLLFDAVLDAFGDEPVAEYGSYRQVNAWTRSRILNWLRTKDFYWDEILGEVEEESEAVQQSEVVQQVDNDTGFEDVYDLENRITGLEILFQRLKERMESRGESSRSNKLE